MQRFQPGAIYNDDLRQQELQEQARAAKLMGLARMALAAATIVSAASYWNDKLDEIAFSSPQAQQDTKEVEFQVKSLSAEKAEKAQSATHESKKEKEHLDLMAGLGSQKSAGLGLRMSLDDAFRTNKELRLHVAKDIAKEFRIRERAAIQIVDGVVHASQEYNIRTTVLLGLIRQESSFNTKAQSSVGAQGLAQVRPDYHKPLLKKIGVKGDLLQADAKKQIRAGAAVLRGYWRDGESLNKALSNYNVGPNEKRERVLARGQVYAGTVQGHADHYRKVSLSYLQNQPNDPQTSLTPNL